MFEVIEVNVCLMLVSVILCQLKNYLEITKQKELKSIIQEKKQDDLEHIPRPSICIYRHRPSICIYRPRLSICFYQPWHSIFVCLIFVLQPKFVIVTVSTYINTASTHMYLLFKYNVGNK